MAIVFARQFRSSGLGDLAGKVDLSGKPIVSSPKPAAASPRPSVLTMLRPTGAPAPASSPVSSDSSSLDFLKFTSTKKPSTAFSLAKMFQASSSSARAAADEAAKLLQQRQQQQQQSGGGPVVAQQSQPLMYAGGGAGQPYSGGQAPGAGGDASGNAPADQQQGEAEPGLVDKFMAMSAGGRLLVGGVLVGGVYVVYRLFRGKRGGGSSAPAPKSG